MAIKKKTKETRVPKAKVVKEKPTKVEKAKPVKEITKAIKNSDIESKIAKPTKISGDIKSFNKLNDFLSKISPDGGILEDNVYAKIDEWIPTGSYILNAALSGSLFGGMPNRRSLGLAGVEGTAKTFIALSLCRNGQGMGYYPIYVDTEGSIDIEFATKLGIDPKLFRIEQFNTIEKLNHFAAELVDNLETAKTKGEDVPKLMFIVDSLGNLSSEKEATDSREGNDKRDMTKQQMVRKFFRVNGLKFAKLGIPLIVIAHVYDAIGAYVPTKEISGGGGLKYNVSVIFMLTKSKLEDKEGEEIAKGKNVNAVRTGVTITITPVKQRFAKPIKTQIHIPFYKKPNPFVGLEPFVNWDACGIMRGKEISEKDYSKLSPAEQKTCRAFINRDGKSVYAFPKETARSLVCKHLGGETPLTDLFTEKVFTQEVLHELDEKIIKPTFMLPNIESLDDLAELTEELELATTDDADVIDQPIDISEELKEE